VFTRNESTWVQQGPRLTISTGERLVGASVGIFEQSAVIGSFGAASVLCIPCLSSQGGNGGEGDGGGADGGNGIATGGASGAMGRTGGASGLGTGGSGGEAGVSMNVPRKFEPKGCNCSTIGARLEPDIAWWALLAAFRKRKRRPAVHS
jgi:hypothetical protein